MSLLFNLNILVLYLPFFLIFVVGDVQALGKAAGAYQQQQQQPEEEEHEGKVAEHEQPQSEEPMPQLRQQEDEAHQLQGDDFAGEVKRPEQEEEEHQVCLV